MGIAHRLDKLRADYIAQGYVEIPSRAFAERLDGYAPDLAFAGQDETIIFFARGDRYGPTDSKLARMRARLAQVEGLRVEVIDMRSPRLEAPGRRDDLIAAPQRLAQAQAARDQGDLGLAAMLLGVTVDIALRRLDRAGDKQPYGVNDELERRLHRLTRSQRLSPAETEAARKVLYAWMLACRGFSVPDHLCPGAPDFNLAEDLLARAQLSGREAEDIVPAAGPLSAAG